MTRHRPAQPSFWLTACTGTALLLPLGACGHHAAPAPPRDQPLEQSFDAGMQAMTFLAPDQAEKQFEAAYRLALQRDDAAALSDAGYNLATAQLARGRMQPCLETVARTRQALRLRGENGAAPALDLVEASALHRLGRNAEAQFRAAEAMRSADPALHARAAFVAGLIADGRGDPQGLAAARQAIDPALSPSAAADARELDARLALRQGQWRNAIAAAASAADSRRSRLDYRGMRQALRLEAEAAAQAGDPSLAASLRARAAQSEDAAQAIQTAAPKTAQE